MASSVLLLLSTLITLLILTILQLGTLILQRLVALQSLHMIDFFLPLLSNLIRRAVLMPRRLLQRRIVLDILVDRINMLQLAALMLQLLMCMVHATKLVECLVALQLCQLGLRFGGLVFDLEGTVGVVAVQFVHFGAVGGDGDGVGELPHAVAGAFFGGHVAVLFVVFVLLMVVVVVVGEHEADDGGEKEGGELHGCCLVGIGEMGRKGW